MSDNTSLTPIPQSPPQVTVDGKPVSQDRIDPGVAAFIMQAAQTSQLVRMRKLEESKIPSGIKVIRRTITDTTTSLVVDPPWISFSLVNDGEGSLTVWINDDYDPLVDGMVGSDEKLDINLDYPMIRSVNMKASPGRTCAVRIYGKVGRV